MSNINFGHMMRGKRKEHGLTQAQLAERTRLGLQTISRIERGAVQPKLEQIRRIFEVLGISLDAIQQKAEQERISARECYNRAMFYLEELRKVSGW